jgi:hypothetical protein
MRPVGPIAVRSDPSTGNYPWITKGGFDTKKEAWQACREAMREADRGRIVKPSARTVAQFFAEWFTAIEPSIDATTWQNWKDYAAAYVIPRIGGERLQKLDEPQLLKLYATLLAEGRVKRDQNGEMYAYWTQRVAKSENPTAREVSDACKTTIHAARAAVRRYRSGIAPKQTTRGLAPKTVRNIHALLPGNTSLTTRQATSSHPHAPERAGRSGSLIRFRPSLRLYSTIGSPHSSCWN